VTAVSLLAWQPKAFLKQRIVAASFYSISACMHASAANGIEKKKKQERKEKTTPFGINSMKSQVLYWAAQVQMALLPFA